jgi:hypothetical protein
LLTAVTRSPVRFEPVTKQQWREELVELSSIDGDAVINPAMAQHISSIGEAVDLGGPTLSADPDALRRLIAREPVSLREFLRGNLAAFDDRPGTLTV